MLHADPAPGESLPQVLVEAQGAGDDCGVAIAAVVDRLAIVGGKGSKVPTLRLRRVSLRCQVAVSARLAFAKGRWRVLAFDAKLRKWSAPGVLTRPTASLIVKVLRGAGRGYDVPDFKGSSFLGRGPLVSAALWASDHLFSEPS